MNEQSYPSIFYRIHIVRYLSEVLDLVVSPSDIFIVSCYRYRGYHVIVCLIGEQLFMFQFHSVYSSLRTFIRAFVLDSDCRYIDLPTYLSFGGVHHVR